MSTVDKIVIGVELAVGVLVGAAFIVPYFLRARWRASPWGRHMLAVAVVMAAEAGTFLCILVGMRVPIWIFEVGFGLADLVVIERFALFMKSQRDPDG